MLAMLLVFQMICMLWELAGMALIGGMPNLKSYVWYHAAQILLQFEVGSICFLISAISRKKQLGGVFSLAVFLYLADMLCRVIPGIEWLKYVTQTGCCSGSSLLCSDSTNRNRGASSLQEAGFSQLNKHSFKIKTWEKYVSIGCFLFWNPTYIFLPGLSCFIRFYNLSFAIKFRKD